MKTKVNKRTRFSNSMPTSPALTAAASPAGKDVTSVPKPKSFRKDPLFLPLAHLLALGPEKEQTLAMKTHTDLDKCSGIVIQIANRDNTGRWALLDEMYKELDVWKFKYPKREMREQAIENAEDAFDRLKLGDDAPEWELLRRPEDRGTPRPPRQPRKKQVEQEPPKKKPAAAASPALPPTIKISKEEPVTKGELIFTSSPALGAEPMSRSVSQPTSTTAKPRGNAESNALKRIIGNKKGPKAKTVTTPKVAAPKEKKSATTSSSTPSTTLPSKSSAAASKSPITPSSAPATTKTKPTARSRTEYKSAEFITDSDSDNMDIDTPPQKTVPSSSSSSSSGQPLYAKSAKARTPQTDGRSATIPSKRPAAISISGKQDTSVHTSSPLTNGHKRNTSMSASPAKPSPLGSSPPMTASDQVRPSSTASSSPLSLIATPDDVDTPMLNHSYTSAPISTPKSSSEKVSSKPRYIPETRDSVSPQHKRKLEETSVTERPRKRVLSSSSEESDESRRRKAPVSERPTIARKAPRTSQVSEPPAKTKKEPIKAIANGVSKKDFEEVRQQRKDLPRPTYASSTTSTTSNVSMSSSDASSRSGRSKYRAAEENITLLAKYKRLHDEYRNRYEKVLHDPNPPQDRVNQVMDLHNRLAEMKIMIQRTVLAS
ncbi:hypothetical protein ABW19_dt0210282 [Dactylella cylindrospora]|nr:hypothetical protein ABW19_dt0210282 [Dactylella cylindrospora]